MLTVIFFRHLIKDFVGQVKQIFLKGKLKWRNCRSV